VEGAGHRGPDNELVVAESRRQQPMNIGRVVDDQDDLFLIVELGSVDLRGL